MYTKKLLLSFCLLASSFIARSQAQEPTAQTTNTNTYLEKGTWLIGGNLSYLNVTQKGNNGFGGNISRSSGLFIGSVSLASMLNDQIALGGKVTYLNASGFDNAVIGPTARLYFSSNKPSKVFLLGDVGFNTSGGDASYNGGLGLANFISNYVSVDITGTYGNTFTLGGVPQSQSSSILSVGVFALQVGLQVYLPKKKI
jgi:hypothetical protein